MIILELIYPLNPSSTQPSFLSCFTGRAQIRTYRQLEEDTLDFLAVCAESVDSEPKNVV